MCGKMMFHRRLYKQPKGMPFEGGIYYFIPLPSEWNLAGTMDAGLVDAGHPVFWEKEVVPTLVKAWAKEPGRDVAELQNVLRDTCYGLPRGRLTVVDGQVVIYHGGDSPAGNWKAWLCGTFGVSRVRFEYDDHERCQAMDRDDIRKALCLRETWPAVSWE